jgi:hypothetical protein
MAYMTGHFIGHALGYNKGHDAGYETRLIEERESKHGNNS